MISNAIVEVKYESSPSTLSNGGTKQLLSDGNGNLSSTLGTRIAGENVSRDVLRNEPRYTPTYISTATTTTCVSGAGTLGSITVQGGTAGTIIVYDNTAGSGTVLASFDSTNALATYMFNVAFTTGCTVVTAAATKLTVSASS